MRVRLTRMLNSGEIRPRETLDDPDGYFGTNWHTPIVFGTRHHGRTGASAFELSPPDIGFGLVHEVGHIDQVAGKTTQEINTMQARRKGDPAYSNFLEQGANSGACLLVPQAQVFAALCR